MAAVGIAVAVRVSAQERQSAHFREPIATYREDIVAILVVLQEKGFAS